QDRCGKIVRDVLWRLQARIHDSTPGKLAHVLDREVERIPVPVDHGVDIIVGLGLSPQQKSNAVGLAAQVRRAPHAVPTYILAPEPASRQAGMRLAKGDHFLEETKDPGVTVQPAPV